MSTKISTESQWSGIEETSIYMGKLLLLCQSQKELRSSGYIIEALSPAQLRSKSRCEKCGTRNKFRPNKANQNAGKDRSKRKEIKKKDQADVRDQGERVEMATAPRPQQQMDTRTLVCAFHTGIVFNRHFSCCQQYFSRPGCVKEEKHTFPEMTAMAFLQQYWQYHSTPSAPAQPPVTHQRLKKVTGARRNYLAGRQAARAIALDCEMGTAASGDSELIRLTAIDLFSQEKLVDQLVQPSVPMKHYNTRYSGVTAADIRDAVRRQKCFLGRDAARKQLFSFISPDTIVIVHGGVNDFTALRWIHPLVIDTLILDGYGPKRDGGRSLKNLCSCILDLSIQGGRGHDSLEDAAACRELAHRWVQSIPD